MEEEKKLSFYQKSISSFIASTLTNLAVTPLDVVKVRLQAQEKIYHESHPDATNFNTQPRLTSTWRTFRVIIRTGGVSSLWSGIWPTLFVSIPITIMYFPLYDKVKYHMGYNEHDPSTSYIPPLAGMVCRATVVTLFNPFELYRTKLQSTSLTLPQLIHATKSSFSTIGPSFLFLGTNASLLRDVPFSAIYWYLYERIKSWRLKNNINNSINNNINNSTNSNTNSKINNEINTSKNNNTLQATDTLLAGAVAGSIAAAATVPFDVIKTHWQIELGSTHVTSSSSSSSVHMISKLWRQKGVQGLFAGFVPRIVRVAPACAIMVTSYEALKGLFAKYNMVEEERGVG